MSSIKDRVVTFSIKPTDKLAIKEVNLLKEHSAKTGTSFSYFMLKAIKLINKELNLNDNS